MGGGTQNLDDSARTTEETGARPRPRPRPAGVAGAPGLSATSRPDISDGEKPSPDASSDPEPVTATTADTDNADSDTEATVRTPRPRSEEAPTVTVRAAPPFLGARNGGPAGRPGPGPAAVAAHSGWDRESTRVMSPPGVPPTPPRQRGSELDSPTERIPVDPMALRRLPTPAPAPESTSVRPESTSVLPAVGDTAGRQESPSGGSRRRGRRKLLVLAAVVGVCAALYIGDLVLGAGTIPRGVTVNGIQVGGLSFAEAEQRLREALGPRTTQPIAVTAGEVRSEVDPATAGLSVDWAGTVERAGERSLNPITRIRSLFADQEVGVVTDVDQVAITSALEQLGPVVDRAPVEGGVRFEGTTPVPVPPENGQQLDVPAAIEVLTRDWLSGQPVALPMRELPPTTTQEDVNRAIEEVARPAVSGPVTVIGEKGTKGVLSPEVIASALTFRADPEAGLVPELNQPVLTQALKPQLAPSEVPGRNATIDFSSGKPVTIPSQDGRGVDYEATLRDLLTVLTGNGPREVVAVYGDQPADITTEEINALGIKELISEFTTGGFAPDSGINIRRAAEQINGIIVKPGETFSLNQATGPRNAANGYVPAGIISDGHPSRGIGGGVSQLATTLYNAAYFAGMTDVAHKEHSFYISRYPPGREATVFEGAIDLKFRNDTPTGVLIQTHWTPKTITVRLYGTKTYEVTSTTGPRTNFTQPNTVTIPPGEPCTPSPGAPGFTITDTRTIRHIRTGEVRTETRTVRYNPSPRVICGG